MRIHESTAVSAVRKVNSDTGVNVASKVKVDIKNTFSMVMKETER